VSWTSRHYTTDADQYIGPSSSYVYNDTSGGDFGTVLMSGSFWLGLLTPAATAVWGTTTDYQVNGVGDGGYVGQSTCGMGRHGTTFCGTVAYLDTYPEYPAEPDVDLPAAKVGPLTWVDCYSVCPVPGDSGGPWMVATYAQGLTSGSGGSVAFFTPVVNPLAYYPGVTVDLT